MIRYGSGLPGRIAAEAPEDAAEEAEDAAQIGGREGEAAQEQVEVVSVGLQHGTRGVARGDHGLLNQVGELVELGRGGGLLSRFPDPQKRGTRGTHGRSRPSEFVEGDGDGLAEIDGGLTGVSGYFDQDVAEGEVIAGKAMFFRAEDEGDAGCGAGGGGWGGQAAAVECAAQFAFQERGERGERDDGLFGLAMGDGAGAGDKGAVSEGIGQG